MKVSIVGASGYTGGELIRILLNHPDVEISQVTSERYAGKYIHKVHPNFRKLTELKFSSMNDLKETDLLFLALPHGESMNKINEFKKLAPKIIDLSADFRLKNKENYKTWYGQEHTNPDNHFVYGIPEIHREEMKDTSFISSAGCLATASILALYPLFKNNLVETSRVIVDAKVGSSAAGNKPSLSGHHPERSHAVRSYKPTLHRHAAEMEQELNFGNKPNVSFSPHAVELVRGILSTNHVFLLDEYKDMDDKDIWNFYRKEYSSEPFIRIVKEREGVYRYPEPKILTGSNFCDIGFERDIRSSRVVVMSAIDNLVKGAAGQAIQSFNIMNRIKETTALEFGGFHPI